MASRLLCWALDLEAQVQGQAGSLCCVFREETLLSQWPSSQRMNYHGILRNAESYVQWTGIHPGCPYSHSKEFEVSSTCNELLSPEGFTDNLRR